MRRLMMVSLVLLATGCSLSAEPPPYSRVTIQVPAPASRLASPLEALFAAQTPPPATSDLFQCLAVNVIGPGIAPAFGNPLNATHFDELVARTSYCTYPGITALIPNPGPGAATVNVNLKVPAGPKRLVQVLGFNDPLNQVCGNGALDSRADNTQAKEYEIGRILTDLFHDTKVAIDEEWNTLTQTDQINRSGECRTPAQIYASAVLAEPSLVAYWPYAETGGTSAADVKGGMGSMTLTSGSLGVATGPLPGSTALRTDAAGGAGLNIGHTFSAGVFTIEMWVKLTTPDTTGALFQMHGGSGEFIEFFIDGNSFLNFQVQDSSGGTQAIVAPIAVFDGNWHYIVAGKRADNYLTIYESGNHYMDSTSNIWNSNAFPFTGSSSTTVGIEAIGPGFQPGDYAHVAIYDAEPTSISILGHYNAAGFTPPPSLIKPLR
jgi:hypothetical protein